MCVLTCVSLYMCPYTCVFTYTSFNNIPYICPYTCVFMCICPYICAVYRHYEGVTRWGKGLLMHVPICVCPDTYMCVLICVSLYVCPYRYVLMCVSLYMCPHMCVQTHTYTHTHTYKEEAHIPFVCVIMYVSLYVFSHMLPCMCLYVSIGVADQDALVDLLLMCVFICVFHVTLCMCPYTYIRTHT